MSLVEQVTAVLAATRLPGADRDLVERVNAINAAFAAHGVVVRKPYAIPALDTVGFGVAQGQDGAPE